MIATQDAYAVIGLDGSPRCWCCGEEPPVIGGRWCSRRCQVVGERSLRMDPTPDEITTRAAAVRRGWSRRERLSRRVEELLAWTTREVVTSRIRHHNRQEVV